MLMANIIKENLIKNMMIIFFLILLYPLIKDVLNSSKLSSDPASAGSLVVVTSVIAVTACFGNFAFTYEKIKVKSLFQRYLAHVTTGLFMLVIGISLIFTSILTSMMMGGYYFNRYGINTSLLIMHLI